VCTCVNVCLWEGMGYYTPAAAHIPTLKRKGGRDYVGGMRVAVAPCLVSRRGSARYFYGIHKPRAFSSVKMYKKNIFYVHSFSIQLVKSFKNAFLVRSWPLQKNSLLQ
jgi:hypothetical protein